MICIFTVRNSSCGKVMFYTCLWFCSQGRTPPGQTPPLGRLPTFDLSIWSRSLYPSKESLIWSACVFVYMSACTHLGPRVLLILAPRPVLFFLGLRLCLAHLGISRTDLAKQWFSHPYNRQRVFLLSVVFVVRFDTHVSSHSAIYSRLSWKKNLQ